MKNINSARQTTSKVTKGANGKITISNIFAGTRNKGLEPDERGWFKMYGGSFNTNNFRGDSYPLSPELEKEFLSPKSEFSYRMANGCLGGECNHPEIHLLPSKGAKTARINKIDKTRECLQVMQIELDTTTYQNDDGSPVTAIWVWVKPTGAYADAFNKALRDPDIQVALSIRTESANRLRPDLTYERIVTKIIAFDWVDIQGIPNATKFNSFSMESFGFNKETIDMVTIEEEELGREDIPSIVRELTLEGCSQESATFMLDNVVSMLEKYTDPVVDDRTLTF